MLQVLQLQNKTDWEEIVDILRPVLSRYSFVNVELNDNKYYQISAIPNLWSGKVTYWIDIITLDSDGYVIDSKTLDNAVCLSDIAQYLSLRNG